jgi:dsRNA-specific ribonuclease
MTKLRTFRDRHPEYEISYSYQKGPEHQKGFVCTYMMGDCEIGRGRAALIRTTARRSAAEKAFSKLRGEGHLIP